VGVVLALVAALGYGVSDVLGGLAARRMSFDRVALAGQVAGLGVTLPVLVSVALLGERPPWLVWLGVLVAVPALWVISGGADEAGSISRAPVRDALAASCGIALQYLCLARAEVSSGLWPILSGRAAAVMTIVVATLLVLRGAAAPRPGPWSASPLALGLGAGVLAATALAAYLFALHTELVTVAVVLASLYPVVPVVVGLLGLGERLRRDQALGLVAALVATVCIAVA